MASFALFALAGYVAWLALLFAQQRRMFYPGAGLSAPADPPPVAGLEARWLETPYGRVEAWFLPPAADATGGARAPLVVFAHGNGELMDAWPAELEPFRKLGMGVLLVEYPGYGRSGGSPSETSIGAAFDAGYDLLASDPRVDPKRIVAYGQSLGGGAVCGLLTRRPVAAAILQSTFSSTRVFAKRYLAPPFLVRDAFDNVAALRRFAGPTLLLHGRRDVVIPFGHAQTLVAASPRAHLLAYDCGHDYWDPERLPFWKDVEGFLRQEGILSSPARPTPG